MGKRVQEYNHATIAMSEWIMTRIRKKPISERIRSHQSASSKNGFTALRGVAKDLFRELGGGEAFIRSERNSFGKRTRKRAKAI